MNIAIIGGGPGGLYFAALMKQLDPAHQITVWERNAPDDTFGFGVVFSDETLGGIENADTTIAEAMARRFARWTDIDIHYRGESHTVGGQGFVRHEPQGTAPPAPGALPRPRRHPALLDRRAAIAAWLRRRTPWWWRAAPICAPWGAPICTTRTGRCTRRPSRSTGGRAPSGRSSSPPVGSKPPAARTDAVRPRLSLLRSDPADQAVHLRWIPAPEPAPVP
ncbi:hypothetical protein SANTM175S_00709 [Streptomyces antimycoticus]